MKTIEEKAKAYDEAFEIARLELQERGNEPDGASILSKLFPELKESEDEKIRKAIYNALRYLETELSWDFLGNVDILDAYAWLEKQGEQKVPVNDFKAKDWYVSKVDGKIHNIYHSVDKVEPNFKVGDWVVWDNKISCHVDNIYQGKDSLMYTITDTNNMVRSYSVKGFDNNAYLWSIQDAKDGDVLAEDSCIFIIQKLGNNSTAAKTYCTLYDDGDFDDGTILSFDIDSTKPATKEQRDTLLKAMADAGYTFDFEKKELKKKIETKFKVGDVIEFTGRGHTKYTIQEVHGTSHYTNSDGQSMDMPYTDANFNLVEQNLEWSEEDEKIRKELLQIAKESEDSFYMVMTHGKRKHLIAYLEKQGEQKPVWSEEDSLQLDTAINIVTNSGHTCTSDWLKSLKDRVQPQPKQEWSEEDEKMLKKSIKLFDEFGGDRELGAYTLQEMDCRNCADWLKSLRPQNGWKPSDEQMKAFDAVLVYNPPCSNECRNYLITLYNELKKLKG